MLLIKSKKQLLLLELNIITTIKNIVFKSKSLTNQVCRNFENRKL